ncbi:MAG: winged helix-turn-helix transcriptional regulator [Candidatus Heimdallarchaeaceae archaeon]
MEKNKYLCDNVHLKRMDDKKKIKEKEEKYEKMWVDDPNKFAIITALSWYGSLNLKKLSSLIGKPETTTLRYLKQLLDENMIEVDAEKTASSWGKFYKLDEYIASLYRKNIENYVKEESDFDKKLKKYSELSEKEIELEVLEKLLKSEGDKSFSQSFKQYLLFIHNIETSITNELIDIELKTKEILKKKGMDYLKEHFNYPRSETSLIVRTIKLSKFSHAIKLAETVRDFYRKITDLQKEFLKEMDEEGVPEEERSIQFISTFLGGLSIAEE